MYILLYILLREVAWVIDQTFLRNFMKIAKKKKTSSGCRKQRGPLLAQRFSKEKWRFLKVSWFSARSQNALFSMVLMSRSDFGNRFSKRKRIERFCFASCMSGGDWVRWRAQRAFANAAGVSSPQLAQRRSVCRGGTSSGFPASHIYLFMDNVQNTNRTLQLFLEAKTQPDQNCYARIKKVCIEKIKC